MPNPNPKTEHLKSHQFPAVPIGYARCKPARLTLSGDLAELWEAMSFELRCRVVGDALLERRDELETQLELDREGARLQKIEAAKDRRYERAEAAKVRLYERAEAAKDKRAEKAWTKRHA